VAKWAVASVTRDAVGRCRLGKSRGRKEHHPEVLSAGCCRAWNADGPAPHANPLRPFTCVDEIIDRKLRMTIASSSVLRRRRDARGALNLGRAGSHRRGREDNRVGACGDASQSLAQRLDR
jgi:hypothetical protein